MPEVTRPENSGVREPCSATRKFTDEVVSVEMAAILRNKTPAERLKIAIDMWDFARGMIGRIVKMEHPDWSDVEIERHVASRMSHGAR